VSTGRQGRAVPSAGIERRRNWKDASGVWIYATITVTIFFAVLAIVYLA